jgi:hypothetical protein
MGVKHLQSNTVFTYIISTLFTTILKSQNSDETIMRGISEPAEFAINLRPMSLSSEAGTIFIQLYTDVSTVFNRWQNKVADTMFFTHTHIYTYIYAFKMDCYLIYTQDAYILNHSKPQIINFLNT